MSYRAHPSWEDRTTLGATLDSLATAAAIVSARRCPCMLSPESGDAKLDQLGANRASSSTNAFSVAALFRWAVMPD